MDTHRNIWLYDVKNVVIHRSPVTCKAILSGLSQLGHITKHRDNREQSASTCIKNNLSVNKPECFDDTQKNVSGNCLNIQLLNL